MSEVCASFLFLSGSPYPISCDSGRCANYHIVFTIDSMIRAGQSEYFTSFRTVSDTRGNWAVIISVHLGIFVNDSGKKVALFAAGGLFNRTNLGQLWLPLRESIRDTERNRPCIINLEYLNYLNTAKSGVL